MPRSCVKISDTVVFGIPRSASSSHTVSCQSLLIAAHPRSTFSGVLLVADLPECGSLSTDSWPSLKCLCHTFICATFIASSPKVFWIIQIVSAEECSCLTQNLMQIHCSTRSFWMWWPHSTRAHSTVTTVPKYREVVIAHACARKSAWVLGSTQLILVWWTLTKS